MSLYAKPVTAADLEAAQLAITGTIDASEAAAFATLINSNATTVAAYVKSRLIPNAQATAQVTMAVYGLMYGAPSPTELAHIVNDFMPGQVAAADAGHYDRTAYTSEALGLTLAFGNENSSTAFITNYCGLSVSAFASAACSAIFGSESSSTLVSGVQTFANNWISFYTSNGVPGIVGTPTSAQITTAAYGAAFGDAIAIAIENAPPGTMLQALVQNALILNAEGTLSTGTALSSQATHTLLQGE